MEIPLLKDVVIILGLAVVVLLIFSRIKVPAILAFFVSGIIAGPQGLGLISSLTEVQLLAELGVIFLLFTIGLDFSLEKFSQIKRYALLGGSLQLGLTMIVMFFIGLAAGLSISESIFIGILVSFSSTAIVLRLLQDKNQVDSVQGRTALGILIFQDVAVVLIIFLTPLLAGSSRENLQEWPLLLGLGLGLIAFTYISTRWLVPELLHYIARFKRRDLFLLTIIVICFGITWATSQLGLSPALGAFLAGLIISNTEYSHQALGNVLPFQDIFMSFFFISIGMLLNVTFLLDNLMLILLLTLGVILLKSLITGFATALLGLSFRVMVLVGLMLSQVGEFSFILAATGQQLGIISNPFFQTFLAVSILTMSLTPFLKDKAPQAADRLEHLPLPPRILSGFYPLPIPEENLPEDHLVIVGFGINGKNMVKAASKAQIPYVVVELNPQIVREEKSRGQPIYYGDASQETVLNQVNLQEARIMVVAISDPLESRKIVDTAKKINPNLYLIVRTRYIKEMEELYSLGADEVIPEEFETSVEIFSRVLDQYHLHQEDINQFINEIRSDRYEMFRTLSGDEPITCSLNSSLTDLHVSSLKVEDDQKLGDLGLEDQELTPIAVVRKNRTIREFDGGFQLKKGDVVIYTTSEENVGFP
jgi:CPA2 family monovalent cation:H+ antiporter-2